MSLGRYFSKQEAESKLGERIRTNREFATAPLHTEGIVSGTYKFAGASRPLYGLDITWDGDYGTDGFSKDDYEEFLEEI